MKTYQNTLGGRSSGAIMIDQQKVLMKAYRQYAKADPDNDELEWIIFVGLCADFGIYVCDALDQLDPDGSIGQRERC